MSASVRPRGWRWALAALPALALALALFYSGAYRALGETLARVGPSAWGLALLGQSLSYAARAARLYGSDRALFAYRFGSCLRLILVNNALNLALPLRAGEASFPWMLKRWFGMDLLRGTGTLIWMRLLDLQVLALAALLGLAWLGHAAMPQMGALWLLALILLLAAPLLGWRLRQPMQAWLRRRSHPLTARIAVMLEGLPEDGGIALQAWIWTLLSWLVKLATLGLLLAGLMDAEYAVGLLGAIGGDLSTVLPLHSPGGFGSFEAGVVSLTAAFTDTTPALLSAALSYHLFVLGCALSAGLIAWALPGAARQTAKPLQS